MRIALVTPGFSADDNDWCIPFLQDFACGLASAHEVSVFAISYPPRAGDYQVKGVPVNSFGNGRAGRLALLWRMRQVATAIRARHSATPFDVLHGFWANGGGVVTALAARRARIRNVVTAMGGELIYEPRVAYGKGTRSLAGALARFGATRADVLTVSSNYHAERVRRERTGLRPEVVVLGTSGERFTPDGPQKKLDGGLPVLCVGSLVPVKCHEDLLKAFVEPARRNSELHLNIVGDGDLETPLRRLTESLGLRDRTTFHGSVEHHELPAYYRGAAFSVISSAFENHAMVLLEAAACGCATVGTRVGLVPELCPPEWTAEPGDLARLAAIMGRFANEPDSRRQLAEDQQQSVGRLWTIKATLDRYLSLYQG